MGHFSHPVCNTPPLTLLLHAAVVAGHGGKKAFGPDQRRCSYAFYSPLPYLSLHEPVPFPGPVHTGPVLG